MSMLEVSHLKKYFTTQKMMALVQDEYFIDIGIPEDYEKAQSELGNWEPGIWNQ